MTKCIMIQGTSSNAGKSVVTAALCRIYANRGYKVAPFKSQNMSLNSFTTYENKEMGIAQVLQANAAKVEPSVHMNPILLKPKGEFTSQVIIQGTAIGDMNFYDYQHNCREYALNAINESLNILKEKNDIIIIEGAGSPAEINMRKEDIANMEIAHIADANVILVADIDRGGVFASIAGTFQLLDEHDKSRLKAVIINKFSGNLNILQPGIEKIEKIINAPILGVLPYDHSLKLPEEDSASLYEHKFKSNKPITIGVIKLPKIANFTDIDPFEFEEDVGLKLIDLNEEIGNVDALIIPGTRNTILDTIALKDSGKADEIIKLSAKIPIIGICGGYQMLGNNIYNESKKESKKGTIKGLGLLNIDSHFERKEKVVEQSEAILANEIIENFGNNENGNIGEIFNKISGEKITGYELHEGTTVLNGSLPLLKIKKGIGNNENSTFDGAVEKNVIGTYFHGIFHNYNFRREFLNYIREQKGIPINNGLDPYETNKDLNIEKLAKIVEENVDMDYIDKLLFE